MNGIMFRFKFSLNTFLYWFVLTIFISVSLSVSLFSFYLGFIGWLNQYQKIEAVNVFLWVTSRIFPISLLYFLVYGLFDSSLNRIEYYSKVFVWFFISSVIFGLVGFNGDNIYSFIKEIFKYPEIIFLFFIFFVLFFKMPYKFIMSNINKSTILSASGVGKLSQERSVSMAYDRKSVAAHEAGHTLLYAALGYLPPTFEAVIKSQDNSLGCVKASATKNKLLSKVYVEWFMLMYLAGEIGEEFIFGENRSLGCIEDMGIYQKLAKSYLSLQIEWVYYVSPETQEESLHNLSLREEFLERQRELIRRYIQLNCHIFDEIRFYLEENGKIDRDKGFEFLEKVEVPDWIPKPLGKFEKFSKEWTEEAKELFGID